MRSGETFLERREQYATVFRELKKIFPQSAARCVMPNHLHVLDPTQEADHAVKRRLITFKLLELEKRLKIPFEAWEKVAAPAPVRDSRKWLTDLRYIHLNPCRDGLVSDPLAWPWSTHRDWVGLSPDQSLFHWEWRALVPWSGKGWEARFHQYISGDPSTGHSGGTVFPGQENVPVGTRPAMGVDLAHLRGEPISVTRLVEAWVALFRLGSCQDLWKRGAARRDFLNYAAGYSGLSTAALALAVEVSQEHVCRLRKKSRLRPSKARSAWADRIGSLIALYLKDGRLRY